MLFKLPRAALEVKLSVGWSVGRLEGFVKSDLYNRSRVSDSDRSDNSEIVKKKKRRQKNVMINVCHKKNFDMKISICHKNN